MRNIPSRKVSISILLLPLILNLRQPLCSNSCGANESLGGGGESLMGLRGLGLGFMLTDGRGVGSFSQRRAINPALSSLE